MTAKRPPDIWEPPARGAMKVFVCHASEDADTAWAVSCHLLDAGFTVWLDRFCIQPGQDWQYAIQDGVRSSEIVLLLVSSSSVSKTGFLQQELSWVVEQARLRPKGVVYVLPLLLDDTKPPRTIEGLQWVSTQQAGWQNVLRGTLRTLARDLRPRGRIVSGKGPGTPSIRLWRCHLEREPAATVDFVIENLGSDTAFVTLGASLVTPSGKEFFDVRQDKKVSLAQGVAMYRRGCPHPSVLRTEGVKLVSAVWSGAIPDGTMLVAQENHDLGENLAY